MLSFNEFLTEEQLQEKLIVLGGGAKYGQIVFLAGGGGSGKGFAADQFMEGDKFKRRDVDEMKKAFLELERIFREVKNLPDAPEEKGASSDPLDSYRYTTTNRYAALRGLNLRNPGDVFRLHDYVDQIGAKDKTLRNMMLQAKQSQGRLPNIMFDITAKNIKSIEKVISGDGDIPGLVDIGYEAKNIHFVWILADYAVAVERNAKRSRVVPDDILLQTHEGAAATTYQILKGNLPKGLDGGVYVVLNRDLQPEDYYDNDARYDKSQKAAKSTVSTLKPSKVVKSFTYIKYKDAGKPIMPEKSVQDQIYDWMINSIPKSAATAHIFDAGGLD